MKKTWLLILTLFYLFYTILGQLFTCPRPWVIERENCFYFQYSPLKVDEAKSVCEENGGFLISVHHNEYEYISKQLKLKSESSQVWLTGGFMDGGLYWHDGSKIENLDNFDEKSKKRNLLDDDIVVLKTFGGIWKLSLLPNNGQEFSFICRVRVTDAYMILKEERDFSYGSESGLTEERGPNFIQQPVDQIVDSEFKPEKIIMHCVATGIPSPKYSWFKLKLVGSVEILEEIDLVRKDKLAIIGGNLVISKPAENEDSGQYTCKVTNKLGSIYSQTATLSFTSLVDFPNSPSATVNFDEYASATLACSTQQYSGRLLYAWYKQNFRNFVKSKFKPYIFISRNGYLYFQSISKDDEGDYVCVVTSVNPAATISASGGKISREIPIRVNSGSAQRADPQFFEGFPRSFPKVPLQGNDVYVECLARGTDVLTYSWRRQDGQALPKSAQLQDHNRVLFFKSITISDSGIYICSVSREQGIGKTTTFSLNVDTKPFFTVPVQSQHIDKGNSFTWLCIADGLPPPEVEWIKNGKVIKNGDNPRIKVDKSLLTLNNIEDDDAGMYQCAAKNEHGKVYSSGQLRVISLAPTFRKSHLRPTMYTALRGNITLPCKPEAAPSPTKTWYFNNRVITNSLNKRVLKNGNLVLTKVTKAEQGTYKCVAENALGVAETSGELSVVKETVLSHFPSVTTVRVNRTVLLECETSHSPVLDVQYDWYQNGRKIDFIDVYYIGSIVISRKDPYFFRGTGTRKGSLVIRNAQLFHSGRYKCVGRTTSDLVSHEATLTVKGPPSPPAGITALEDDIGKKSAKVQFFPGNSNGEPIREYVVEAIVMRKIGSGIFRAESNFTVVGVFDESSLKTIAINGEVATYEATIEDLSPFTTYKFRVRAINSIGRSKPSEESKIITTKADRPSANPTNVGGGGGKVGELRITWTPVPYDKLHGEKAGYVVYWRKKDTIDWEERIAGNEATSYFSYTVGSKNFYMPYEVKVRSKNVVGLGPPTNHTLIYSAADLPPAMPSEVRPYQWNATALLVEWVSVNDTRKNVRGKLGGYRINYWRTNIDTEEEGQHMLASGNIEKALVIGLYPNVMYSVSLQVFNGAGFGPKTNPIFQRTLRKAPMNMPTEVTILGVKDGGVSLNWRGVSTGQSEEPLQGYMVKVWRLGETLYEAAEYDSERRTHIILEDLPTDREYYIRVYGYSRGGQGTMSSPATQIHLTNDCNRIIKVPYKRYVYKCSSARYLTSSILSVISMLVLLEILV
ncbi:DgyrCDS3772 [Dimorphilus gyrociliatus]|uniref:DgyrCDS3772 n=1 Tax=Dimorphilus gyrociliatus TaxID=2664684 RepID=A0A7I8VGA9_9ANNE|nr:DgyrCDS3772 [Dimorphilus gyrociliatus]